MSYAIQTSVSSVAGAPSSGRDCTKPVILAARPQTASSSRPSMFGRSAVRVGRTVGRPVKMPAALATPSGGSVLSKAMPPFTPSGVTPFDTAAGSLAARSPSRVGTPAAIRRGCPVLNSSTPRPSSATIRSWSANSSSSPPSTFTVWLTAPVSTSTTRAVIRS